MQFLISFTVFESFTLSRVKNSNLARNSPQKKLPSDKISKLPDLTSRLIALWESCGKIEFWSQIGKVDFFATLSLNICRVDH